MHHAACFDSLKWCRVENIYPLLQIGVQLLPSAGGRWRLCCGAQDSNARDISQLFLGDAYLLELVVLHLFVLVTLGIQIPSTEGLSTIL